MIDNIRIWNYGDHWEVIVDEKFPDKNPMSSETRFSAKNVDEVMKIIGDKLYQHE